MNLCTACWAVSSYRRLHHRRISCCGLDIQLLFHCILWELQVKWQWHTWHFLPSRRIGLSASGCQTSWTGALTTTSSVGLRWPATCLVRLNSRLMIWHSSGMQFLPSGTWKGLFPFNGTSSRISHQIMPYSAPQLVNENEVIMFCLSSCRMRMPGETCHELTKISQCAIWIETNLSQSRSEPDQTHETCDQKHGIRHHQSTCREKWRNFRDTLSWWRTIHFKIVTAMCTGS